MRKSFSEKIIRYCKVIVYLRLIKPLIHSNAAPEYKARGVAIGLAWSMTPLVGIQMALVAFTWGLAKKLKWGFSLPLALAWTWITNVVTLVPIYYIFYVCGQILRGHWHDISGYQSLGRLIEHVFLSDASWLVQFKEFLKLFVQDWGISMFIGCIPFIIGGYIAGYKLTLKFEQMRHNKKLNKATQMQATTKGE